MIDTCNYVTYKCICRHYFHEGPIGGRKKIRNFFEFDFFPDVLIDFIEIYNPTKLQGLKLISFVITLIGQGQNGC